MNWNAIIEIITLQITLYVIFIKVLKKQIKKCIFLHPIISIIVFFLLEKTNYNNAIFFFSNIILYFILPIISLKKAKIKQIIFISFAVVGMFSLINSITSFLFLLFNVDIFISQILNIIINIVLVSLIIFLSYKSDAFYIHFKNIILTSKSVKIVFIMSLWILFILISLLTVILSQYPDTPIITLACFLIILVLIISLVVIYLLIMNNIKSTYYKKLNTTIQNNMIKQVNHYERLAEANESLRKFRHDFNNLKIGLFAYLQNNNITGAMQYIEDCNQIIKTDNLFHTGHYIVDALFSDKAITARENNINISFSGLIPQNILTPVDLCMIFGNALDNAIEACLKIDNDKAKSISVSVKQNNDYIFVTFTNPTFENVEIKDNTIITTKENHDIHGIGLYSIKQVLKKYDGHMNLHCENNLFTTEIDFCISKC